MNSRNFCDEVQDALIDETPLGLPLEPHLATCSACQGLYAMTNAIHDELKDPPAAPIHKPQWIAAVHQRQAEKRTRRLRVGGGLVVSLAVTLLWIVAAEQPQEEHASASLAPTAISQEPVASRPAVVPSPGPTIYAPPDAHLDANEVAGHCRVVQARLSCHGRSSYKPTKEAARQSARNAALEQLAWYLTNQAMVLNPSKARPLPQPLEFADDFVKVGTVPKEVGMKPLDYLTMIRGQLITTAHGRDASAADTQALESWQAKLAVRMESVMGVESAFGAATEQWRWEEYESETKIASFEYLGDIQIDLSLARVGELIELVDESPGFPLAMWTEQE